MASTKIERLEKAPRDMTGDNAKTKKILAYYDNPHTPLPYPGMDLINNGAERDLRPIVIRCKISGQIGSVNAQVRHPVHVPADMAQAETQCP